MDKKQIVIGVVLTAVTLTLLWAITTNVSPALRGPADWRWSYAIPSQPARHLWGVGVVAGYGVIAWFWGRRLAQTLLGGYHLMGYLLFCFLAVPLIQLSLLAAESPNVVEQLFFRTVSPGSSGFFSVGSIIEQADTFLTTYPEQMPTFPVHPQRYPPGIPLLFYMSRVLMSTGGLGEWVGAQLRPYQCTDLTLMRIPNHILGSALLQMLLPLWSGLVIFPLFGLARRTLNRETAVWSVAIYPLVPSFVLWAGRWDQFFPFLAVTLWYLLVVGVTEQKHRFVWASGCVLALVSMFSFGLLILIAPLGIWVLLWGLSHRRPLKALFTDGLLFAAGFTAVWALYQLAFQAGLWHIWRVSMGYHLGLERSYWTWLGYHLYDFGLFLGIPLALLSLFAFFYALLTLQKQKITLPIAFGFGVLLLDVSGTARGEVARVWIFLTPFAVLAAVWAAGQLEHRYRLMPLLFGLLAIQLLTFNAFLRVVNTGMESVPARVPDYTAPATQLPSVRFGHDIVLSGYDLPSQPLFPGTPLSLSLYWQTDHYLDTAYSVFTHVINSTGDLVAQQDGMPVQNSLPTTCWQPGEVIVDSYEIVMPADVLAGTYTVFVGLYNLNTGERLPVAGVLTGTVPLGQVVVVSP